MTGAATKRDETVTIIYFADEKTAYWTEDYDGNGPAKYSANRYATFHGWDLSAGRQVHGLASSPLNYPNPRRYFIRNGIHINSWRRVETFAELSAQPGPDSEEHA